MTTSMFNKWAYAFLFYSWFLVALTSCASIFEELNNTDYSTVGAAMQRAAEPTPVQPSQSRLVTQQSIHQDCKSVMVRDEFYGTYKVIEVCQ